MSNNVSLDITVAKRLHKTYYADSSIVYDAADPDKFRYMPVKITGNSTVGLCEDGDIPFGSITLVEFPDAVGTKVNVESGQVVNFNIDDSALTDADAGKAILAGADGVIEPVTTGGVGILEGWENGVAFVNLNFTVPATTP